jgi:8-hydroxy-5-deazaflavin:NADPH oxidoreductase
VKIGIVGAGNIGKTAARLFAAAGHAVAVSNSRGPESLAEVVTELGPGVQALSVEDAARFGDVVLLAVPWRSPEALPPAEAVQGKVVIDAMNQYGPQGIIDLGEGTASEETAKRLPGARLVKAFNTMNFQPLGSEGRPSAPEDERLALYVAGDDAEAKAVVAKLIDEIGFTAVDTGSLREGGKRQEPDSAIYNRPMAAAEARRVLNSA